MKNKVLFSILGSLFLAATLSYTATVGRQAVVDLDESTTFSTNDYLIITKGSNTYKIAIRNLNFASAGSSTSSITYYVTNVGDGSGFTNISSLAETIYLGSNIVITTTPNYVASTNTVFIADRFQGSGSLYGDFVGNGFALSNLNGAAVREGTIKSNAIDWTRWPIASMPSSNRDIYYFPSRPDRYIKNNSTYIESDYRSDGSILGYSELLTYFARVGASDTVYGDQAIYRIPKKYITTTNAVIGFELVSTNITPAYLRLDFVPLPRWDSTNFARLPVDLWQMTSRTVVVSNIPTTVLFTNSWTNLTDSIYIHMILNTSQPTYEFNLLGGHFQCY